MDSWCLCPGVQEEMGSLGLMWYDDDDEEEEEVEDEEERLAVRPTANSRQSRDDQKDPDYQIPARLETRVHNE